MRALVREALLSQSQVSRTVAILVDLGLLARHGAGTRSVRVSVTPAGRERLAAAVRTQADTLDAVLFHPLTEQDVRHLTEILDRIQAGARYPNPTRAHDVPDVDAARPEPRGDRAVAAVESLP
jgi:DNA-binding MarR family transcriptional regulator